MVARADQHLRLHQLGRLGAQHLADAQRQRFEPAQRAQGLGLEVEDVLQARGERGVGDIGNGGDSEGHGFVK